MNISKETERNRLQTIDSKSHEVDHETQQTLQLLRFGYFGFCCDGGQKLNPHSSAA